MNKQVQKIQEETNDESVRQNFRYPHVTHTGARNDDVKLHHQHSTYVVRPPLSAKDPLGLPQYLG